MVERPGISFERAVAFPSKQTFGWVVSIGVEFTEPQLVNLGPSSFHVCRPIEFHAEQVCERFEQMVGVSGIGFYDWNAKWPTFALGMTTSQPSPVPMDF